MKKLTFSIVAILTCYGVFAKNPSDTVRHYHKAFTELQSMLNDERPISFKRAVFVTENAYLDNSMDYEDFNKVIEFLSYLSELISDQSFLDYDGNDEEEIRKSFAIYTLMKGKMDFIFSDDTVKIKEYTYDFDDFWGEKDWSKMFVSKLTGYLNRDDAFSGNCHSLPALYKILADEIGVEAYLSIAPNHTYIKQRNDKSGWYNTELTTGSFPYDKDIKWNSYIKTEAVANGIYMDTLSNKQSIAYVITDLAQGYIKKHGYKDVKTPIRWLESALHHYPNYINALILKAELQKKHLQQKMVESAIDDIDQLRNSELKKEFQNLENSYMAVHQTGYRRMPKEMYLNWLFQVSNDTTRKPHHFETPQPFKEYDYEVFVATAGDGYNYEFYDQDTITRIGTIEINRLTGKIVNFVEYNYSEEMPDDVVGRIYDPAIGRFWQVDPLSEVNMGWSPYNYAQDNPIRYNDPDGMIWKDPNEAEKLKGKVQSRIDQLGKQKTKLQGKLENGDLSDKQRSRIEKRIGGIDQSTEQLNGTIDAIDALGADQDNTFDLVNNSGESNHVKKGSDGVINIQGTTDALHVHEITHVSLSLKAGGLQFGKGNYLLATSRDGFADESTAYKVQFSFAPSSLPGSGVNSHNDIDLKYLGNLKTSDGRYVYPALNQRWVNTQKQNQLNKKMFKNMEKNKNGN